MTKLITKFLYWIAGLSYIAGYAERIVLLIPFAEHDQHDTILHPNPDNYWYQLQQACAEAGYTLTTKRDHKPQEVYAVVAFNAPQNTFFLQYSGAKKILYLWEPPTILSHNFSIETHNQFDTIATWHDGLVDNKKYVKFNYALLFQEPDHHQSFEEKKLCCMFVGNKFSSHPDELYSKRLSMIKFLNEHAKEDFDLYGTGWGPPYSCYKGFAPHHLKIETMKKYRFSIVYENMKNIPGYITEKIFDAFSGGCVPVYWGASNIEQFIPKECFIAREDFASDADVYAFLKNVSKEQYQAYIDAISRFIRSDASYPFSREQFIETFLHLLAPN